MPAKIPVLTAIRIVPREDSYLDIKTGAHGEIFYDRNDNTLRLYDGQTPGGTPLAKSNLSNVSNTDFLNKATAAGVTGGTPDLSSLANVNLSNVSNTDFLNKATAAGISAQNIFDQSLNTTDNVSFNTVTASQLISSGTGTPTYTSGGDFVFNTGNNNGSLIINGSIEITDILRLVPQSSEPVAIAGTFAVANGLVGGWDPASKGLNIPYPVFYNGNTWQALY